MSLSLHYTLVTDGAGGVKGLEDAMVVNALLMRGQDGYYSNQENVRGSCKTKID
jgi:hypothetical protein